MKYIKAFGRMIISIYGYAYDTFRYLRYSGWRKNISDPSVRDYHLAKISHALEKSMAFRNRNPSSGWANALELIEVLDQTRISGPATFQRDASEAVLRKFIELPESREQAISREISGRLGQTSGAGSAVNAAHGRRSLAKADLAKGVLADPEAFFLSRASIREYVDDIPSSALIERAVRLSMSAPSACNRQPWSVYYTVDPAIRDAALKFQSGNRGFGHQIPCLLVVAIDQRAFMPGQERYQHWIDGGMFAMSLIYALHSLGLVSCALNWSQSPSRDLAFRRAFQIADQDSIIMMLAVGFPKEESLACASERRPLPDILAMLEPRSQ